MLRACYSTEMVFGTDPSVTAPVRWFFAQPGALDLGVPTTFCSRNTVPKGTWPDIGEVEGAPRPWNNGSFPIPVPGTGHFCGRPDVWADGWPSPNPPGLPLGDFGIALCCGDQLALTGSPGILWWPFSNFWPTTVLLTIPPTRFAGYPPPRVVGRQHVLDRFPPIPRPPFLDVIGLPPRPGPRMRPVFGRSHALSVSGQAGLPPPMVARPGNAIVAAAFPGLGVLAAAALPPPAVALPPRSVRQAGVTPPTTSRRNLPLPVVEQPTGPIHRHRLPIKITKDPVRPPQLPVFPPPVPAEVQCFHVPSVTLSGFTFAWPRTTTPGNFLAIVINIGGGIGPVTPPVGWQLVTTITTSGNNDVWLFVWPNAPARTSETFLCTSPNFGDASAIEISGVSSSSALDQFTSNIGSGSSITTGTTAAISNALDLVVVGFGGLEAPFVTGLGPLSYTVCSGSSANTLVAFAQAQNTSGQVCNANNAGSPLYGGIIACFTP